MNKPLEAVGDESPLAEGKPVADSTRGFRLNPAGQDHVRSIARQLANGAHSRVVVERSNTSRDRRTRFRYPVHWNRQLDEQRRTIVVRSLEALGIANADSLVVVAPAFPFGLDAEAAASNYNRIFQSANSGRGGNGIQSN